MKPQTSTSRVSIILGSTSLLALLAFSPISPRSAHADNGGWESGGRYAGWGEDGGGRRGHGGPQAAPEFDAATAAQGLVLIGGALVVIRRYRRKN